MMAVLYPWLATILSSTTAWLPARGPAASQSEAPARWTLPQTLPRLADDEGEIYAAALLPAGPRRGQVLLWRDWLHATPFPTYVVDPRRLGSLAGLPLAFDTDRPGILVVSLQGSEIGCPAMVFDREGRLLTAGGHAPSCGLPEGSDAFNVFDPRSLQWIESHGPGSLAPLQTCRHYPSGVFIPNDPPPVGFGDLFAVFGGGDLGADSYEVHDFTSGTWSQHGVPAGLDQHDYTFVDLIPGGLFLANPGPAGGSSTPTWYLGASQSFVPGPPRSALVRQFVGRVLLDRVSGPGLRTQRLVLFGGTEPFSPPLDCADFAASDTIEWIDDPAPHGTAVWSPLHAVLRRKRTFGKAIALPDGTVALLGGADHDYNRAGDTCASGEIRPVREVEIYDPLGNTSVLVAAEPVRRMYHSVALLLPDGRVFSAGGDTTAPGGLDAGQDVTLFSPPYLRLESPVGVSVSPVRASRGGSVDVRATLPPGTSIAQVTLTAPGVSTHQIECHERWIELELEPPAPGFAARARLPSHIWRMLPGWYLLWVVLDTGAVSRAVFLEIT